MRKPLIIRRVRGDSMLPALPDGKIVIATGWFYRLKPNNIVIVSHNNIEKIKRIKSIDNGRIFLVGDNPKGSTDSRQFGKVDVTNVLAKKLF
jgi:nickel-type superoxide dismutase maturation protease